METNDNQITDEKKPEGKKSFKVWIIIAAVCVAVFIVGLILFFVLRKTYEIALVGNGTEESPYLISDKAGLDEFATAMNKSYGEYGNKRYKLESDIDMQDAEWTPVNFCGYFDGNGKKISNFSIDGNHEFVGFFATAYGSGNSVICDLTLDDVIVTSSAEVHALGIIVGDTDGKIINCSVNASITVTGNTAYVGGVVGSVGGDIEQCRASGEMKISASERMKGNNSTYMWPSYGGVVGHSNGSVRNCVNDMSIVMSKVESKDSTARNIHVGGVVGAANSQNITNSTLKYTEYDGLVNNANIVGVGAVGGVIGTLNNNNALISNCMNYGNLFTTSDTVCDIGGILARTYTSSDGIPQMKNCGNEGDISSTTVSVKSEGGENNVIQCWAGGVLGAGNIDISGCYSKADVVVDGTNIHYVGGLCGGITGCIKDSYHIGDVTVSGGSIISGGVVGVLQSYEYYGGNADKVHISMYRNYSVGSVTAKLNVDSPIATANYLAGGVLGFNMLTQNPVRNNYFDSTVRENSVIPSGATSYKYWYGEEKEGQAANVSEENKIANGGISTEQFKNALPSGFVDYSDGGENAMWVISEDGYPYLYWEARN